MIWSVEMKLLVDDEVWDVREVQQQLAKTVSVVDGRPRFVTAANWMVTQMEDLKSQPPTPSHSVAADWMPSGRAKRRLNKGPTQ